MLSQTTMAEQSHPWRTAEIEDLFEAILSLEDKDEVERFLRDLCTLSELEAIAHRWEVAKLLDQGITYQEIANRRATSTTTVTSSPDWLRPGDGGYRTALDRLRRDSPSSSRSPSRPRDGCASRRSP